MCEVAETTVTADETTSAGLMDVAGSAGTFGAGAVRPEEERPTESKLDTRVQAAGLILGLLVFLRFSLTPWLWLVSS